MESKQISVNINLGNIKRLEIFFKNILSDDLNMIAPFFYLYDLRTWSDHSNSQNKFDSVVKSLELNSDSSLEKIYKKLIEQLHHTLNWMLNKLQEEN